MVFVIGRNLNFAIALISRGIIVGLHTAETLFRTSGPSGRSIHGGTRVLDAETLEPPVHFFPPFFLYFGVCPITQAVDVSLYG